MRGRRIAGRTLTYATCAAGAVLATSTAQAAALPAFESCGALLSRAQRDALRVVGPWGLGGGAYAAPAPEAGDGSQETPAEPVAPEPTGTNVQEPGVDEPDIAKTDGRTIFTVAGGELRAVDTSGPAPTLLGTLPLGEGFGHELLLRGSRLLVLSTGGWWFEPLPVDVVAAASDIAPGPGVSQTFLTEVDVSDPAAMRVVRTLTVDASLVAARLSGSTARVVVSSQPTGFDFVYPESGDEAAAAAAERENRRVIKRSGLATWIPRYRVRDAEGRLSVDRRLVRCRDVRRPRAFSDLGLVSVLTIDLDRGVDPVDTDAIMAGAETVYASPTRLYVATQRWVDPATLPPDAPPPPVTTALHAFDVATGGVTDYRASGAVSGYLLGQWSLSERGGVLRAVSTDAPLWWGGEESESETAVTALAEREGRLVEIGRLGGLGRGERVYAVRFVGELGYVVTFRQVDPLHVVDLADPEHPRLRGELHIPGYSSYLHPIGDGLLLGVGQDATAEGRILGTQVSVFDVSDPASPTRLHHLSLGGGSSEAEWDHHAFLYDPATGSVVIPLDTWGLGEGGFEEWWSGAVLLRASRAGIEQLRTLTHVSPPDPFGGESWPVSIRRSLVLGGTLYTLSDAGALATSLDTLADLGWAGYPLPDAVGGSPPGAGVEPPVEGTSTSSRSTSGRW
ncbi:MAG: beta-propeller domain-containing protein [Thermoleophilia bacterium]|nr:beta-propeller domain-containing protein [Thermoleophilia bacterium]